ncbi:hypothetical protein EV426DRAFT_702598 [Tirmania nivea]|nr:hypothetical protein EV426DRAFT_702598 [Tirmania nivea]
MVGVPLWSSREGLSFGMTGYLTEKNKGNNTNEKTLLHPHNSFTQASNKSLLRIEEEAVIEVGKEGRTVMHSTSLRHGTTCKANEVEPGSLTGADLYGNRPGTTTLVAAQGGEGGGFDIQTVVANEKGRRWKQIREDPEWCEKLAEAVRRLFLGESAIRYR